jgi:protein NirF
MKVWEKLGAMLVTVVTLLCASWATQADELRGTGDMGIVIERSTGSVLVVENTTMTQLARIEGLGDLSHASAVYSRDARYAFVFGRDGGLSKIDILNAKIVKRTVQADNSIGGAISQDGRLVAVSNYEPGGVKVFDSATLDLVADIPTGSTAVGLVDAPGSRFVFSLYEAGEIWIADMDNLAKPAISKFTDVGLQPYDALMTPNGRYYIAGLFGEDGMAMIDLWNLDKGVTRILDGYGRGEEPLPVYKMPHLEGWAIAGMRAFVPAVGRHEVMVVDMETWQEVGRIPVHGQPVFVMAQPDGRQVWVNYAFPLNDTVQVIDTQSLKIIETLTPGAGVLHMEFTPRGEAVWVSVRDLDLLRVFDTKTFAELTQLPTLKPSGIFFTWRAARIGL